jgi:pimeloyl-ACP methyl ester carboxylesterase
VTGFEKVIYFGHSQGTTQWFIANCLHSDINQYFKAFVGFAPVATVGHQESALVTTLDLL